MGTTSTNPLPLSLFDLLLRSSMDYFLVSNHPPRDPTSSSSALLLNSCTNSSCLTNEYSHVEDLIHTLKYLLKQALITLQVSTKEEVDPTTTLATLESLMVAISRTTDHFSESIAQTAMEGLRQLSLLLQKLQKKLDKYNSTACYLGITSTVAIGVAACAVPAAVGLVTVQPLSQLLGTLWKERMMNPLERKLKVAESDRFIIHSMIVKVSKMKDMVQGLVSLVAKREHVEYHERKLLEELEKALLDALTQLEMVDFEQEIGNLG